MPTGTMDPGLSWGAAAVATSSRGPSCEQGDPRCCQVAAAFRAPAFGPGLSLLGHAMARGRCRTVCAS